jgi:hypothetical protein
MRERRAQDSGGANKIFTFFFPAIDKAQKKVYALCINR